ncbi:MAG TPA: TIGR03862 family flavoprotein, partial [Magnetospirillaceae bacterium]|nr:TIGR03862 family flavoprotein [Magnetospirillaceae bacterium]
AGLFAAEILSRAGLAVSLHDRMTTFGRKFLMAGRGGLNITHSEPLESFLGRYGTARGFLAAAIEAFPPQALRDWCQELGQPTFVGSSGRVFPEALKASPLLRAWLARLQQQGVTFHTGSDWLGWDEEGRLRFRRRDGGEESVTSDATLLALGGASWPRLGSDGGWTRGLADRGVAIAPLRPANCGFLVSWSDMFKERFQGQPVKPLALSFAGRTARGEAMISAYGIEGGAVYALSAALRDAIDRDGKAELRLDLCPDRTLPDLVRLLSRPRKAQSYSTFLKKTLNLSPVAINLLREAAGPALPETAEALAALIHDLPLTLTGTAPIERAISSAGGIALSAVDERWMLKALPGVFAAGEMLDWEAPTGGYLLQASFASARAAALGLLDWIGQKSHSRARI